MVAKVPPPKIDENGFRVRDMTDAEALAARADFMAHDRHDTEARQMLEDALKADPKLGIACDGLSFLALQQGNAGEGEQWSSQALALDPHDYRTNYYYAWSLLKSGRIDKESLAKAEASLRAVTNGNPEFVPAYDAMAYVLSLEGGKERLDEAYMMTLQAVGREPGNVHYRVRAVEVLERQQRPDDAVRVATLAVSMAKTPEEQQEASAALAGAQAFQESWAKHQAMQANQAADGGNVDSGGVLPTAGALNVIRQVNISAGVAILSSTQGVDFNSYLNREVMPKIQREWAAQIQSVSPEAAAKEGRVIIEFLIDRDGSVADVKLKQSAQEQKLDDVVRGAIQSASPFAPLPEKFRGKNIALLFQCDYNVGEHTGSATAGQGAAAIGKKEVDEKSTKHPVTRPTTNRSTDAPIPARASTAVSPRSAHGNALRIAPPFADVAVGAKQQFAAANLPAGKKVVWKVSGAGCAGASCGTITPDGLYTAPVKTPSPPTVTVTAASADTPTDSVFALVTILPSSTK